MYCSNVIHIVCIRHGISNRGKMNVHPVGVLVCVYIYGIYGIKYYTFYAIPVFVYATQNC